MKPRRLRVTMWIAMPHGPPVPVKISVPRTQGERPARPSPLAPSAPATSPSPLTTHPDLTP